MRFEFVARRIPYLIELFGPRAATVAASVTHSHRDPRRELLGRAPCVEEVELEARFVERAGDRALSIPRVRRRGRKTGSWERVLAVRRAASTRHEHRVARSVGRQ